MSKNVDALTIEAGSPENPSIFGKYLIFGLVARGGMAEVYRARRVDRKNDPLVALKVMRTKLMKEQKYVDMFLAEGQLGRMLRHPNIVETLEGGRFNNIYFFTMEYIMGKDLSHLLRKVQMANQRIPVPVAVYIAQKCAEGLHYAHALTDGEGKPLNLVNRDVSPSNIRVSYDGDVKILDFGIARTKIRATSEIGTLKGKFSYMSPEQVRGLPLDCQTDIFSLGIVLHEMLTMERLFKAESETMLMERVRESRIEPPSSINKRVSAELDRVVLKALAREKKDRYQTAAEFAGDLAKILEPYRFSVGELADLMRRTFHEDYEKDREILQIATSFDGKYSSDESGRTESLDSILNNKFDPTGILEMEMDMELDESSEGSSGGYPGENSAKLPPPGEFATHDPNPAPEMSPPESPSLISNKLIFALLGVTALSLLITVILIIIKKS